MVNASSKLALFYFGRINLFRNRREGGRGNGVKNLKGATTFPNRYPSTKLTCTK
jgi:hypothetical protein